MLSTVYLSIWKLIYYNMNPRYYADKLRYEVGEVVLYQGKEHKIVHIHEDGLVNLENGWFYIYSIHPYMFYKIK
jgi:hypothetical protein